MKSNAGCWRLRLAVLAIATSGLTGCATEGFEANGLAACPPIVEYSREFQARAVDELALLPSGSAIADMLSDYAVMREQARACDYLMVGSALLSRRWDNERRHGPRSDNRSAT